MHVYKSLQGNRLYRSIATKLDNDQLKLDLNFNYLRIRIAINAVQICINKTLPDLQSTQCGRIIPMRVETRKFDQLVFQDVFVRLSF